MAVAMAARPRVAVAQVQVRVLAPPAERVGAVVGVAARELLVLTVELAVQ
jgi:hypothetical protein